MSIELKEETWLDFQSGCKYHMTTNRNNHLCNYRLQCDDISKYTQCTQCSELYCPRLKKKFLTSKK